MPAPQPVPLLSCNDPVQLARDLVGTPYCYSATLEDAPQVFNCYTFTQWIIYARHGILLPCYPEDQYAYELCAPAELDGLQRLDLVFTSGTARKCPFPIGHVGLATGENTIIHATNEYGKNKGGVFEISLDEFLTRRTYKGARRFLL